MDHSTDGDVGNTSPSQSGEHAFAQCVVPKLEDANGDPKTAKFHKLLHEDEVTDLNQLKIIAWSGIPKKYRPLTWKLLLGYLPVTRSKREQQLERKRQEYARLIEQYYNDRSLDDGMWRQIHIDIPRMQPLITVFQHPRVQQLFERILYIWSIRHPASGYVQGMNDLVTPFFLTYLSEFSDSNDINDVENFDIALLDVETLSGIEADTFWSFGKLLDSIQNNYTFAQPGIQRLVKMLARVVSRADADLHNHLRAHNVDYLQFAFRWMNNLLIREIPLRLIVRLWDSYLAEGVIVTFSPTKQTNQISSGGSTSSISGDPNSLNVHLQSNLNEMTSWTNGTWYFPAPLPAFRIFLSIKFDKYSSIVAPISLSIIFLTIKKSTMEAVIEATATSMDIPTALRHVLRESLFVDGLSRGLDECARALDKKKALLCVASKSVDEPRYLKLIEALCKEHQVPLVKVDDSKQLGEWAGLCKIDKDGQARKVVGCSSVCVTDFGKETSARDYLMLKLKQSDNVVEE
ncbi:TBC1 domain family member 22B [Fragariocoptes setiger]|uniref:40S ribosomal protein S12 n=1 Tax=Fragariocoptes setiger TaxID=1670756 RepID=A0ABQ7S5K2_9ACAR|nr:TBC1 domain family member 22B [Fragariocoptes setiger]